jgi:signal transduction histidine kinase
MEQPTNSQQISSYIIYSQEEEIKRISQELHEGVGQNLYSILTGLQFVQTSTKQPHLKKYLHEMTELLEKNIQEVRLLSVELHPPTLTTLGLLPAIKSYIKLYTSTFGILVDLNSSGEERQLSERHRIAVFRVCQEALANIAKYADTSDVKIDFYWRDDELNLIIRDFGQGFKLEEVDNTLGISAMKERMHLTGGDCTISSTIGEGTSIEISLPYEGKKES